MGKAVARSGLPGICLPQTRRTLHQVQYVHALSKELSEMFSTVLTHLVVLVEQK